VRVPSAFWAEARSCLARVPVCLCACVCCVQTKDQPELNIPAPEVCQHLGAQLTGAAAVVLSQLLASYIEGVTEDTFLTADSSVFSSSAGRRARYWAGDNLCITRHSR